MSTRFSSRTRALIESSNYEVTLPELSRAGSWEALVDQPGPVPISLEIGTGKDPHLVECAHRDPDVLHIGIEHSRKKLERVHAKAIRRGVTNVRLLRADIFRVLDPVIPDGSLVRAAMLFPDPWPKKRHSKKRMLQQPLVDVLAHKVRHGRVFELRTDHAGYLQQMLAVLDRHPCFDNDLGPGKYTTTPREPETHVPTLFEKKYTGRGLTMHYLRYIRTHHVSERCQPAVPLTDLGEHDALHGSSNVEHERRFGVIQPVAEDFGDLDELRDSLIS